MRKKRKFNLLLRFFALYFIISVTVVYFTVIEPFVPYERTRFKSYQSFYDVDHDLTMPKKLPEYCHNVKYYYRHGMTSQKAYYCTVDDKDDILRMRDRLEREYGTSALIGYYDPKWLKTTMKKRPSGSMAFSYIYPSDREETRDIESFDIYRDRIKPIALKLTESDEGWYCVCLYEERYSDLIQTFGIMANQNNEVIEFCRHQKIETR